MTALPAHCHEKAHRHRVKNSAVGIVQGVYEEIRANGNGGEKNHRSVSGRRAE
jgi:hypothetical protein